MVAHPVRGVDYPATYQQLLRWFPDNDACLEYLGRLRWEDGFVCPACGGDRFWRTGAGLWMCRACQRRTSVTCGTIFHRTRTPMSTWFAAIWFVFAGLGSQQRELESTLVVDSTGAYVLYGEHLPGSWVWRKLSRQRPGSSDTADRGAVSSRRG